MSWRSVVVSSSAKLDYQMGYLVVRKDTTHKVHLSEIGLLIIESTAVSLTVALISELIKRKIKVIFCDEKRNPSCELLAYYGAHDTSAKIKKQIAWSVEIKTAVWTEIVSEKIRKQRDNLSYFGRKESQLLHQYLEEIEFGDLTNREGHAAKVYFNALFGKDFSRTTDCNINAALNYGYSIILSMFNREIVANGYLTQIGLFHDNMFNSFNLASDLMEPFRVVIDRKVMEIGLEVFDKEEKMWLVNTLNDELKINGRKETVGNAIKIYCKSILEALEERDISLIKFYHYEL